MKRSQTWLVSWYLFGTCCSLATAADITLAPVTASGPHTIVGNDITLQGSGQFVTLEIQIANWDPNMVGTPLLQSYQASIDSSGYTSGLQGTLAPKLVTCPGGDIDCRTAFGGICVLDGLACVVDADCAFPSFNPCVGPACNFPPGFTDFCEPAFITDKRPDFVFSSVDNLPPALDVSVPNFRYAATVISASVADPGIPQYAGSLILDVPVGARGTFTVGFLPLPSSLLQNDSNLFILPLNLNPVRITIACQTNLDCDDGSVCTTDQCQPDGTCTNTPNFNSAIFCCNPSNGNLTTINDQNVCTDDVCDAATGTVNHSPVAVGTACGSPANTECDNPDTCNAAGMCQSNFEPSGFACGNPADTDCDNPDTCNGAGTCLPNNEPDGAAPAGLCADANDCTQDNCLAGACSNPNLPFGTACGNPGDTDCDNPDTCNGAGTCLANNEPDGTAPAGLCNDGNDCTQDNCLAAACSNPNEALGTACGSPSDTDCDNPDTCDGAGVCLSNNEPDGPAPPGLCGDGNGCTQDNCLAAACSNPNEAVGTACGDPSNTDCTNPDSCDGAGLCLANDAAANTPCGNPASTDCDKPDTCNGTGTCLPNLEPNGTLCNDNLFCTVNERCTAGTCGNGFLRDCGDAIVCTDDSCDEVNDVCVNQPNDTLCNNGQFCDGIEICDAVLDCVVMPGSVPDCNDLVGCTDDSCDEVNDVCVNQPNDTLCNNGQFCDGVEICDSVQDCIVQAGSVPNPDDGIACTDDSCDEVNDVIVNVPNDTLCPDDGLFCNGNEFCNAATGCDHTGSPCGGPCDEVGDVCLCDAPIVMAAGNRYLKIMPQPPGSGPQAIVITPDCPGSVPFVVCPPVPIDIDRDGLVDEKVAEAGFLCGPANIFLTPAEWGELYVFGKDIVPGRTYIVQGDCGSPGIPGLSDSATATTANFGDTTGVFAGGMWTPPDDDVDIFDLLAIVSAIKNEGTAPAIWQTDLIATGVNGIECLPDQATELIFDAVVAINAFQGRSYTSSTGCPAPCP